MWPDEIYTTGIRKCGWTCINADGYLYHNYNTMLWSDLTIIPDCLSAQVKEIQALKKNVDNSF